MTDPQAYVNEINSITNELKRLNAHMKSLREQRKRAQLKLYEYMVATNLIEYEGIKIKSVTPKPKTKRKPKKQKIADAVKLFRDVGIPDPESFWKEFEQTQKYNEPTV